MKKFFIAITAIIFALGCTLLVGCATTVKSVTITAPEKAYVVSGDGSLDGIVTAADDKGNAVAVTINNDGGFDKNTPGVYNVEYKAEKGGVTDVKTVAVEVVGLDINFPKTFTTGKVGLSKPVVTISEGTEYSVGAQYRYGTSEYRDVNFAAGSAATLKFEEAGEYTIRARVTFGEVTLEKEVVTQGVTAKTDDSKFTCITGSEFTVPNVTFSSNATGTPALSIRREGEENFVAIEGGKTVLAETGYYDVKYSLNVGEEKYDYIHKAYARKASVVMDFEGTDGTHFGNGDKQWKDNGGGAALLEVSDEWSHDGKYSLKHNQVSKAFWAGLEYNRPLEIGAAADTMVCYIYSESDYPNVDICIYTDESNYASARFAIKKGEYKYYIKFNKQFDRIKLIRSFAEVSTFYFDAIEFGNYDVSNVLSLSEVTFDGSGLSSGDTYTLPIPAASSSIYSDEDLAGGTLRLFASRDGGDEEEIPFADGAFSMTAETGTYTFRYVFACDGCVAERVIESNVAKYNVTATVPSSGTIAETFEIADVAGGTAGDEVTLVITAPDGEEIEAVKSGDKYTFVPNAVGYYTVYVRIQGDGKWGENTFETYVRAADMSLDFEGVGENRGYVNSYTPSTLAAYVPIVGDWSYDGRYSTYFNMSSNTQWYGLSDINLAVPAGSNSVTFVLRAVADYDNPLFWWVDTDTGSTYTESFMVKAGVHTYTVRIGANDKGVFTGLKSFGTIKQLACFLGSSTADVDKPFWLDAVVFHPYTEFSAQFTRPEIKLNEEYTFTRPAITSDVLTSDEIEQIEMIVEYEKDGVKTTLAPTGGALKLTLTEKGIYTVTVTLRNSYAIKTASFDYAFGTIAINAELPSELVTGKDYTFELPAISGEDDISGATVKISYAKKGSATFTEMTKKLGKYTFNVNAAGEYVIRYAATAGSVTGTRDYVVTVYQAGVFMDFEPNGKGGWVENYYGSPHFLPELSDEWGYDGTHSLKIKFRSDGWYGFKYANGLFSVPQGTDKISVWVKSDRTFTNNSFLAFEAFDSNKNKYVWYYMDEFRIEKGVNLYEGRLRLYGNLETYVEFTPALAGTIRAFTFHTEHCDANSDDFDSVVYFDSVRFSDTDTSNFNDLTILPAVKNTEYAFAYASPSGFSDENLVISYRKEGESEWITLYENDAYDGEDITYTFDFAGKVDIRIVAVYGELFATYRGTLTIGE